jgi:hypothetical protein
LTFTTNPSVAHDHSPVKLGDSNPSASLAMSISVAIWRKRDNEVDASNWEHSLLMRMVYFQSALGRVAR